MEEPVIGIDGEGEGTDEGASSNPSTDTTSDTQSNGGAGAGGVGDSEGAAEDAGTDPALSGIRSLSVEVTDGDDFYHMPDPGRPYLAFVINDPATTEPITQAGSTVTIQGPRSGTTSSTENRWGGTYTVLDCVTGEESCGVNSLDQDSRPGHFAVDRLTGGTNAPQLTSSGAGSRYRIGAGPNQFTSTPVGYQWTTAAPSANGSATALSDNAAGITAFIEPVSSGATNINTARTTPAEWVSTPNLGEGAGTNMVHTFDTPPALRLAPYLTWQVTQNGAPVGGATVRVQGPRTGSSNYGISYNVPDCTSAPEPCATDSMDQDPAPGKFKVYNFRAATGGAVPVDGVGRYRIQLANSTAPLNLQWVNASGEYLQPGSNNTTGTWSTDGNGAKYYDFSASPGTPFAVQTAPYLTWEVTQQVTSDTTTPVGGATVRVQGPRTGTGNNEWGATYNVPDCTTAPDPCAADSMDQDPAPGKFKVYNLRSGSTVNPVNSTGTGRYRLLPADSTAPLYLQWSSTVAIEQSQGTGGTTTGSWLNDGTTSFYSFGPLVTRENSALVWEVRKDTTTGALVGGSTAQIRGPRTSNTNWGTTYTVTDCMTAPKPCPSISMDQDPEPGKFKVFSIGIGDDFSSRHTVRSDRRYGIQQFGSPFSTQWIASSAWIDIPGSDNTPSAWPAATTTADRQWAFDPLLVRDGNYLVWDVSDQNGSPVGGATVEVQAGTGSSDWGDSYFVTDCTEGPCHPDSMDQDPAPGKFRVDTLRGLDGSSHTAVDVHRQRYQIAPRGSIPEYTWTTPQSTWQAVDLDNWPDTQLSYTFPAPLLVQSGRAVSNFCSVPTDGRYYTLARENSGSASTTIRQLAPTINSAGVETGISTTNAPVAKSAVTLGGSGQTANALGITSTGVFYFTGQVGGSGETARNATVYRFDPQADTAPYPVMNMDLLSPTTGTIVSGDAMIYQGREEFYFAYYSNAPAGVNINGQLAIRFHLYRYSHGNGDRTGEVHHIDVERPANMNNLNGDFAFDGQNNLQFIISDNDGRTSSGVVNADDFVPYPSAHALPDVGTIQGSANVLGTNNNRASINGITYTKSGRAILQRNAQARGGNNNFVADMPSFSSMSSSQTFSNTGYFVDLASCDTPTTISVKKEVVGPRYNANDQFTLKAERRVDGQTPEQFASATTTGNKEGVQTEMVGPFVTTLQGTFHASEEFTQNDERFETAYECKVVGASTAFLKSDGYAADTTNRSLSFALNGNPSIDPGDQIECTFKNRRYAADLKVSKTSEPVTGTSMAPDGTIRYVLTFDNTTGSAPARDINYIDWLRDVLDDADLEAFGGGHYFEYRSSTNGAWSATPEASQNQIVAHGDASSIATSQKISITGQVPSHGVRQVSFLVKVKANSADRGSSAAPLQSYLLRNYLTPATTTEPPTTCEIPASPGLPLCTEHPVDAWTMEKYSQPSDGAAIHSGGNIYYRVKVTNFSGHDLNDVVIRDNMTQTMAAAVLDFNAPGAVPQPWGISFYRADGTRITSTQESGITAYEKAWTGVNGTNQPTMTYTAGDTGSCILANEWPTGGQSKPASAHGCWQFTTPEFDVPHKVGNTEIAYAEVGYVVRGGAAAKANQPTVPVVPSDTDAVIPSQRWINTVQAGQAKFKDVPVWPNECSADGDGVPTGPVEADSPLNACKTEHSLGESYFHIWKKFGPATPNSNNNLLGAEFLLADTEQDARGGNPSRWLCRVNNNPWSVVDNLPAGITARPNGAAYSKPGSDPEDSGDEDFGATSNTHAAIVKWNELVAQDDTEYLPNGAAKVDVCGQFFQLDASNLQGQPEGAWRAVDVRGGDTDGTTGGPLANWRTASALNVTGDGSQGRHGTYWLVETKAPSGYELLAQPMQMWVAPAAVPTGDISPMTQKWYDYQGRLSLPVVGVGETPPDPLTGHIMPPPNDADNQNIRINCTNPWQLPGNNQPNCVMPTGWTMPVFNVGTTKLPLTGGGNTPLYLLLGGAVSVSIAVGGATIWRRRKSLFATDTQAPSSDAL